MNIFKNPTKGMLVLQDGSIFEGYSFGAIGTAVANAVYHTSVVGFVENLTTPSNVDNIVVQTFPLYGNYGVCYEDLESSHIAKGVIVREWCDMPSNYRMETDINTFLKEKNVIGLYNLDTRALTKKLRDNGSMLAVITTDDAIISNPDKALLQQNEFVAMFDKLNLKMVNIMCQLLTLDYVNLQKRLC